MRKYNTMSMKQAISSGYIKVTADKVQVLHDCRYLIDVEDKTFTELDSAGNTITCFGNFLLEFDEEKRVLININDIVEANFSYYEETAAGILCYLNENEYLFDKNIFPLSKNNSNSMLNQVLNGKLGKDSKIPYEDVYKIFKNVMEKSGVKNIESLSFELIVSEICRQEKDVSKAFRLVASPVNQHNFVTVKIKDIGKITSPISALNSEDITDSLAQVILSNKNNQKPILTPIEQIALSKFDK